MVNVRKAPDGALRQLIQAGDNQWYADAAAAAGGEGSAPDPHDLLDSALAACTALTVTMVARRKQMPLDDVRVQITREESGGVYKMRRQIELVGDLTSEQRDYLMGIVNKCPIHKALNGRFEITTESSG